MRRYAMAGKPASLVQLCALGADMNFENKNSQTALTLACRHAEATRVPYPTIISGRDDVNGALDQLCELGATVGRCRLTVSKPVLKAPTSMVSALEAKVNIFRTLS